jgi:hypothetical protein
MPTLSVSVVTNKLGEVLVHWASTVLNEKQAQNTKNVEKRFFVVFIDRVFKNCLLCYSFSASAVLDLLLIIFL